MGNSVSDFLPNGGRNIIKSLLAIAAATLMQTASPHAQSAPATDATKPGQAIDAGKVRSAKGQWLYVEMAPNGAKLGWGDPAEEHFDGIRLECSSKRRTVLFVVDVGAKGVKLPKAVISRGTASLKIGGNIEEGPSGSSISGGFNFEEFILFVGQPGNIIVNISAVSSSYSNISTSISYSSQDLDKNLLKLIKQCGIEDALKNPKAVAAPPLPSPEIASSIFVKACTKDGSGNVKQCSCAEEIMRRKFGPRGYAVIELAIQSKMEEAKAAYQRMSAQEQFNYGAGIALAANSTNAACGTHIRM